jgi:hypothetical protein
LISDDGLIFSNENKHIFIQKESIEQDFSLSPFVPGSTLFVNYIYISRVQNEFRRDYLKIQEVAATVGGFFSISFYILRAFYYFYVENHLQAYYYKNLLDFRFDYSAEKIEKKIIDHIQTENEISIVPFENRSSKTDEKTIINENTENLKNERLDSKKKEGVKSFLFFNQKPRESIDIDKCTIFKHRFCCVRKVDSKEVNKYRKTNLLNLAEKEINRRLDTLEMLKLIDQIDIIKRLILNENQVFMLNNKGKKILTNQFVEHDKDYEEEKIIVQLEHVEKLKKYLNKKKSTEKKITRKKINRK